MAAVRPGPLSLEDVLEAAAPFNPFLPPSPTRNGVAAASFPPAGAAAGATAAGSPHPAAVAKPERVRLVVCRCGGAPHPSHWCQPGWAEHVRACREAAGRRTAPADRFVLVERARPVVGGGEIAALLAACGAAAYLSAHLVLALYRGGVL